MNHEEMLLKEELEPKFKSFKLKNRKLMEAVQPLMSSPLKYKEKKAILGFLNFYREVIADLDGDTPSEIYTSLGKLEQDVRDMVGAIEEYHNLSIQELALQYNTNSVALDKLLDVLLPKTQALLNRASNRVYGKLAPKLSTLDPKQFWCVIIVARQMLLDDNNILSTNKPPSTGRPPSTKSWIRLYLAHDLVQLWLELGETNLKVKTSDAEISPLAQFASEISFSVGDYMSPATMRGDLSKAVREVSSNS